MVSEDPLSDAFLGSHVNKCVLAGKRHDQTYTVEGKTYQKSLLRWSLYIRVVTQPKDEQHWVRVGFKMGPLVEEEDRSIFSITADSEGPNNKAIKKKIPLSMFTEKVPYATFMETVRAGSALEDFRVLRNKVKNDFNMTCAEWAIRVIQELEHGDCLKDIRRPAEELIVFDWRNDWKDEPER